MVSNEVQAKLTATLEQLKAATERACATLERLVAALEQLDDESDDEEERCFSTAGTHAPGCPLYVEPEYVEQPPMRGGSFGFVVSEDDQIPDVPTSSRPTALPRAPHALRGKVKPVWDEDQKHWEWVACTEEPICSNCGNDLAAQGRAWCTECLSAGPSPGSG